MSSLGGREVLVRATLRTLSLLLSSLFVLQLISSSSRPNEFSDAVCCGTFAGKRLTSVIDLSWGGGGRRRQRNQTVHYGLTPRWSERSIGEHNNKVQPQVRGDESTPAASGVFVRTHEPVVCTWLS